MAGNPKGNEEEEDRSREEKRLFAKLRNCDSASTIADSSALKRSDNLYLSSCGDGDEGCILH